MEAISINAVIPISTQHNFINRDGAASVAVALAVVVIWVEEVTSVVAVTLAAVAMAGGRITNVF